MSGRARGRVLLALCLLALHPLPADAHARSTSWSSWWLEGREARVVLRVPQLELTRLPFGIVDPPRLPARLGPYVSSRVRLLADGKPCPVTVEPRSLRAPAERAVIEWQISCAGVEGDLQIESRFLQDVAPTHMHFARLRADGAAPTERVLTEDAAGWSLAGAEAGAELSGSPLLTYLRLGVGHILTGADHLVFLLGLLLLASRLREVVTIVTGFTVAHSATLALAAVGSVRPASAAVEALIGLSIVLVALENGWLLAGRPPAVPRLAAGILLGLAGLAGFGIGAVPASAFAGLALFTLCYLGLVGRAARPARLRFAIAFGFGLVHGFGFAGVLAEIELPRERLLPALLGFNLGVEAGQLAMVAIAWPALLAIARYERAHRVWLECATAAVCAAGVFWLVSRTFA